MTNTTMFIVVGARLLTDEQYVIIMESSAIIISVLSFLGITSNIINIITFVYMGLSDGVTVSFLFLSLFDLQYLIMSFCFGDSIGLSIMETKFNWRFQLEPYGLFMFFGNVAILLNVVNTLTTTFLAVARCMCVAKPLQFKNTFTRSRTIVFNIGFAAFAVAVYTPILANMAMLPRTDKVTNLTRPSLWFSKNREAIKDAILIVVNTILLFFTEVVIMVCVVVMATSLRASSKFRQASTLTAKSVVPPKSRIDNSEKTQNTDKLSGKDQRVVQQVIIISGVYIICNTAKIIMSVVGFIEPQYRTTGLYRKLYVCVYCLQKCLEIGNASVNTFIYYSYNTKFRKTLQLLFSEKPDTL